MDKWHDLGQTQAPRQCRHLEHRVVGADAHVADGQQAEGLDEPVTPLEPAGLGEQGRSGKYGL